jgi:uncharacterized peroxidase-related enzyme
MSLIPVPTREEIPEASHAIYDQLKKTLGGRVPNMFSILSLSPNALDGVRHLQGSLAKTLNVRTRHLISLAVSQVNGCQYCLSAHTYTSGLSKMTPEEILLGRQGKAADPKEHAAVAFAKKLVELRGKVPAEDVIGLRSAGYTDAEIIEIISLCAQFLLTNFINNAIDPDVDFPAVDVELGATA